MRYKCKVCITSWHPLDANQNLQIPSESVLKKVDPCMYVWETSSHTYKPSHAVWIIVGIIVWLTFK